MYSNSIKVLSNSCLLGEKYNQRILIFQDRKIQVSRRNHYSLLQSVDFSPWVLAQSKEEIPDPCNKHCLVQSSLHCSQLLVWQGGTEHTGRAAALVTQTLQCPFQGDALELQNIIYGTQGFSTNSHITGDCGSFSDCPLRTNNCEVSKNAKLSLQPLCQL